MQRHKDSVDAPARDGDAQVFVLPPDLLEKLGIQLSNITATAENSIVDQSTGDNTQVIPSTIDGSSILETANLMKQSVFMSPTFISTTGTETASELNVPNIVTETVEPIQDNDEHSNANTDKVDLNSGAIYDATLQHQEYVNDQTIKNRNSDLVLTSVFNETYNNINTDMNGLNKKSSMDDHADEAYSSDGSNSNSRTCPEISNNHNKAVLKSQKSSNKIKILSEKIINNADLNNIQSSLIQKNNNACFLIPVSAIVTGKATKSNSNNQLQQKPVLEELCSNPEKNKVKTVDVTNHAQSVVEDFLSVTHSESRVLDDNGKSQNSSKDAIDDDRNSKIEVTLDIDKHNILPNDNNSILNNFKEVNEKEKPKAETMDYTVKEIVSNTDKNSSKSKLCIQGVEKPGGMHKNQTVSVLKTYQRINAQKHIPELPHIDIPNIVDSYQILPDVTLNLNDINIDGYKNANKFCICKDFGQLANYDGDIVYEHIHFCQHNSVGCDMETLFSMYDDVSVLRELSTIEDVVNDEDIDVGSDDKETTQHNICWLSFICENNDETEEQIITEATISNKTTNLAEPRRSNRKRKSTSTENFTENFEAKSNKSVKCGVCGLLVTEAEWSQHNDSEHNLTAWKDGQIIVGNLTEIIETETLSENTLLRKKETTSWNSNLTEKPIDKTSKSKITRFLVDATFKKVKKSTSIETVGQCKSKESTTAQIESSKLRRKSDETSDIVEKVDVESTENISASEDSVKSKYTSIDDVSLSKSIVKSLDNEKPVKCTRHTNTFEDSEPAVTPKKRMPFDVSLNYTAMKITPNTDVKRTPKTSKRTIDGSLKANTEIATTSTSMSTKCTENKSQPKATLKNTPKPKRKSIEVSKTKEAMEATRNSNNIEVTPKLSLTDQAEVTSKTPSKSIDNAGYPKLTPKTKDNVVANITKKSECMTDALNKSPKSSVETKSVQKTTNEKTTTTRKLKQIDIFTSPTTGKELKKICKIESQSKLTKKSRDDSASLKSTNVETSTKSTSSTDVSSRQPRKSAGIEDKKNKSIDVKANTNTIELGVSSADESSVKSIDVTVSSKALRQYTRKRDSKETLEISTSTKSEMIFNATEKDINSRTLFKSSPQNSVCMETEITALGKKTATTENETPSKSNVQDMVESSSGSGNNVAQSSPKINKITEGSKEPQSEDPVYLVSIKEEILPKCGVCKLPIDESQWLEHIAKEHGYLAWREDETPLDLQNDEEVRAHLYGITKAHGGLRCSKCNLLRKYVKSYLTHIQSCWDEEQGQMDASTASVEMDTSQNLDDIPLKSYSLSTTVNERSASVQRSVECGVCSETVLENKWIDHIRMEHKYLAWKKGEPPVDLEDEAAVKSFLRSISTYYGGLICSKCGAVRSYVKKWMDHVATCKGVEANESDLLEESTSESSKKQYIEIEILAENVKCAKCGKEMPSKTWMDHIEKEHNYLSWVEGQPPLDESNSEAVSAYLHALVKKRGALYCVKCGVFRKYPKAFLNHVSACEMSGFKREDFYVEVSAQVKPGEYECAVCHEIGHRKDWKKHAMVKHYNIAWMAGEIPINLKNPYAVEKYLKEYRTKHNLVCKVCGASRASCYGFYAHILTCGKSEEELADLMDMCDICNNTYLCIYRNQHKAMHKEAMIKKEKKERDAIRAEEESMAKAKAKIEGGETTGKRRAAEKAKKVMERYTLDIQDGSQVCLSCHMEFDNQTQLEGHECSESQLDKGSESDASVKMEGQEESEDDMEGVDSTLSDEEEDPLKRKRHPETTPKIVLPYKVKDFNYYLAKSFENFCEIHYTNERLFNKWQSNDYRILSNEESDKYLPTLSESCKLRIHDEQWDTYKRFEARKKKITTIFTGAAVRCMQWVPHRIADSEDPQDHYLCVVCFRDGDSPRYGKDELPEHPGMLQFWNMGKFTSLPKLEMGLTHDYGTVWGMDWCPSGARDEPTDSEGSRLGLLAIACSNGRAYIISVPRFHAQTQDEPIIIKMKPVAELRLSLDVKQAAFRKRYQATSISWSPQKGHEVVMVGYADGTTALYDLNTESPILKATEDGVEIFYPFQDALTENSSITGVALCASGDMRRAVGGVATSSVTGATMASWPRGPVVRSHLAASSVAYTPNWPAALLCSDDVLTVKSTNEMEWWGGGRRLGGACASGACARCGRICLTAPPFVRVLRAHPVYPEIKKQIFATLKMVLVACKRKYKQANDSLGMVVEPLTYDETIKKYGLEFKTLPKKYRNVASKLCDYAEQCADRFPLSDMPAAAFCPTADHHHRLAVATHAGFIFIIST